MYAQKSQRGSSSRFHSHHGSNIVFENNQQTAIRSSSFANAICFSEKHLAPGEIFLVEIEEIESGWSGHMRIGLTQMNPNSEYELPLYALPDLVSMGPCWLYAITKRHNNIYEARHDGQLRAGDNQDQIVPGPGGQARRRRRHHHPAIRNDDFDEDSEEDAELPIENFVIENNPFPAVDLAEGADPGPGEASALQNVQENSQNHSRKKNQVLIREGDWTWTPCGFIQHKSLMPKVGSDKEALSLLPTDVGSRIGVMFNPTSSTTANMHFIINGEDQGPCARNIPYDNAPIYAVVDVYGSTKRIRTVQVYGVDSLQSMCRDVILQSIHTAGVTSLPLPNPLKAYLLFH